MGYRPKSRETEEGPFTFTPGDDREEPAEAPFIFDPGEDIDEAERRLWQIEGEAYEEIVDKLLSEN
jgi:hypothetical protein